MTIKLSGTVEPYYRDAAEPETPVEAPEAEDWVPGPRAWACLEPSCRRRAAGSWRLAFGRLQSRRRHGRHPGVRAGKLADDGRGLGPGRRHAAPWVGSRRAIFTFANRW